jgi:hypothetical protein
MVRTFGRWDCINARQRERVEESRFAACTSLLTSPATRRNAAKVRGFSISASGFTAETDCPLEEGGFEPLVPLTLFRPPAGLVSPVKFRGRRAKRPALAGEIADARAAAEAALAAVPDWRELPGDRSRDYG